MSRQRKKDEPMTRSDQEKAEGYALHDNGAPSARYQSEQQVKPADATLDANAPQTGFGKKTEQAKGSVLKQQVAATVVTKGIGGNVPENATSQRTLAYSGNEGTILGSAAYTPSVGQSRSDSRLGKKLDAVAKKLNYVPSEQIELEFESSKPLAQSPDSVQGYNGTPRNTNARMQKVAGTTPADMMFVRSIDEIKRDHLYWAEGQVVHQAGVDYHDTPAFTASGTSASDASSVDYLVNPRGNYLHRALHVHFTAAGTVDKFYFDVVDASSTVDADTVRKASSHGLVDMNIAELDRQNMDHKAGDEKAEIWTPLARAVREPTQTVAYLRDLEAITGSEVFVSYMKTAEAMSYNLNRAAKDGLKVFSPMAEALLGLIIPEATSQWSGKISRDELFCGGEIGKKFAVAGAASLFVAINDSTTKYNTKADILLMPKSIGLALQTADNNMNPLRMKKETADIILSNEVFSTIGREYDPLLPTYISDRVALFHCYDFNDLYAFDSLNEDGTPHFRVNPFSYQYSDLRNWYRVTTELPLLAGIHDYLNSMGSKFRKYVGDSELVIPMIHSGCFFSLWSLIVLSATPFICRRRINSMRDVLYYEKNVEYPFSQLVALSEVNPMGAVNFSNSDYHSPLVSKMMQPAQAVTWVMPELFIPINGDGKTKCTYILPWYFNENGFDIQSGNHFNVEAGASVMSYPVVRSGSRFGPLEDIMSMDERELRLSLDMMVGLPLVTQNGDSGIYKYGRNNDGLVVATFDNDVLSYESLLKAPRELGLFMVAPGNLLSCAFSTASWITGANIAKFADVLDCVGGATSYLAKCWHGRNTDELPAGQLKPVFADYSIVVNRAAAYVQDWDAIPAIGGFETLTKDIGIMLSTAQLMSGSGTLKENASLVIPFLKRGGANGADLTVQEKTFTVATFHRALWTRTQMLPFVISPWDCVAGAGTAGAPTGIHYDPFDFAYIFGLCGFQASDYREDSYNRDTQMLNQGFGFTVDPFVEASPLFHR